MIFSANCRAASLHGRPDGGPWSAKNADNAGNIRRQAEVHFRLGMRIESFTVRYHSTGRAAGSSQFRRETRPQSRPYHPRLSRCAAWGLESPLSLFCAANPQMLCNWQRILTPCRQNAESPGRSVHPHPFGFFCALSETSSRLRVFAFLRFAFSEAPFPVVRSEDLVSLSRCCPCALNAPEQ